MKVEAYEDGAPYWAVLTAPDIAAASSFYEALFGWQGPERTATGPAQEVRFLRGLPVAGVRPTAGALQARWRMHVNVADAQDTARKVIATGGKLVVEPTRLATHGRFAVFADTSGAELAVWEAGDHKGAGLIAEPGALAWSELITDDVGLSAAFYGAVFGWTLAAPAADDRSQRREWQSRGRSIAGLLPRPSAMPKEIPPYWDVFFGVSDPAATVESVTRLGGKNLMPPIDTVHGRIAVFMDPAGVVFSVIAPNTHR
jgi:predicted enzyme related to lactoylglutathione lyase